MATCRSLSNHGDQSQLGTEHSTERENKQKLTSTEREMDTVSSFFLFFLSFFLSFFFLSFFLPVSLWKHYQSSNEATWATHSPSFSCSSLSWSFVYSADLKLESIIWLPDVIDFFRVWIISLISSLIQWNSSK